METLVQGVDKLLIFDCEFWHVFSEKGYINVPESSPSFFFTPRELGGIYMTKDASDGGWNTDLLYATFDNHFNDVSFPTSKFASVSAKTAMKLDKLEIELGIEWTRAYPKNLTDDQRKIWNKGLEVYKEDSEILKAKQGKEWMRGFMEKYSQSRIVVKGEGDIIALKNYCKKFKLAYKDPIDIVDIARWNKESQKLCGNAKLETSFNCILDKLSSKSKKLIATLVELIGEGNAHDPRTDSIMTLGVALYLSEIKY